MATKKIIMIPEGDDDYGTELYPKTTASQVVEETDKKFMTDAERSKLSALPQTTYDRASSVLSGANVFSNIVVTDGAVTALATRAMTKSDLGLSAVVNYGIATQAEAQAGTSDAKYMTPLRVKEAVRSIIVTGTYTGNGIARTINTGITGHIVLITSNGTGHETYILTDTGRLHIDSADNTSNSTTPKIVSNGFTVGTDTYMQANRNGVVFKYVVFA